MNESICIERRHYKSIIADYSVMKFHESHFEDYLASAERYSLHPSLDELYSEFPESLACIDNIIIYGPGGSGKYTQALRLLRRYSPTSLKYSNRITANTEKQSYIYNISDIHYEIDMSLLGCNSKTMWSEIFSQITEIVSVKSDKRGIIVCKNFHSIHNELLDIFYSYIQQFRHPSSNIHIHFIMITEHISFIPNNILSSSYIVSIPRPSKDAIIDMCVSNMVGAGSLRGDSSNTDSVSTIKANVCSIMCNIKPEQIMNLKEIYSFVYMNGVSELPRDIFNIVCDSIIAMMHRSTTLVIPVFRDLIYDILVYNLDVAECIWYILCHFIKSGHISTRDKLDTLIEKLVQFLKYRNNNYREIFHLERILFTIIVVIFDLDNSKYYYSDIDSFDSISIPIIDNK